MVSAIIFSAHLIFVAVIFTKKWQDESLTSAFINLALIVILFTVGWSVSTSVVKLVVEPKGFGLQFDADAIALTLLVIGEYFFFRFYYGEEKPDLENPTEDDKET